jgi:dihydroorotate dehydrogenase (NAD+) catalytic subunit
MNLFGIQNHRIAALAPETCIACHCCKGSCPAGLETIDVAPIHRIRRLIPTASIKPIPGLQVQVGRLTLPTPLVLASGPIGRCADGLSRAAVSGFGAVVTKSITSKPRAGNPAIRVLPYGKDGLVNCEGLPNLGARAMANELERFRETHPEAIVVPSVSANRRENFIEMATLFASSGADALELALHGCSNVDPNRAEPARRWIEDPDAAAFLIESIRQAVDIPLWVKVNHSVETAIACQKAGADALIVRRGSAMALPLDPETGRPLLSHPRGEGVFTGPHTKPAGLQVVAEMAQKVSIPIIGNGGVCRGQDVIDYLRAGASAVELITVLIRKGMQVLPDIVSDLEAFIETHGLSNLQEIRGQSVRYVVGS